MVAGVVLNNETSEDSFSNGTIVDDITSIEDVVDDNTSIEDVVDDNTSIEDVVDDTTSIEDVVDDNTSIEDVIDDNTSTEDVVDDNTSIEDVVDDNTSNEDVVDDNTSNEDVVDDNTSIEDVVVDDTSIEEPESSYISLASVDFYDSSTIDVNQKKYITSDSITGNHEYSNTDLVSIEYQGNAKYKNNTYSFIDNDVVLASGYTGFSWDEDNSISISLENKTQEKSSTSLYLKAGAWQSGTSKLQIKLNDEIHFIELTKGYRWFYIRIDLEFIGDAKIEIKPSETIGGYSYMMFGGITMR